MKTRPLALASLAALLAGCSAEFSGITIAGVCAPPVPQADTLQCVYTATCDAFFAGTAVLDAAAGQLQGIDFRLPVEIDNTLPNNADTTSGRINTNDATIQSLEVSYPGTSLPTWNVPATVTVRAAGTSGAVLRLIRVQDFAALAPSGAGTRQIDIAVRAHGVLGSQDAFTTAWFHVPVIVCNDCLPTSPCPAGKSYAAACPSAPAPGPVQTPTSVLCQ
jgi:hypothetical protein